METDIEYMNVVGDKIQEAGIEFRSCDKRKYLKYRYIYLSSNTMVPNWQSSTTFKFYVLNKMLAGKSPLILVKKQ